MFSRRRLIRSCGQAPDFATLRGCSVRGGLVGGLLRDLCRFMDERPVLRCCWMTSRLRWCLLTLAAGGLLYAPFGCVTLPGSALAGSNTVQISADQRDAVWERAVSVLNRNHFQIARESKLEGLIETDYRAGSGLLEPWHPDSIGLQARVESTLQSIRRRVIVLTQSAAPGLMTVSVRVDKEIEDLPGLAATYEGGATFSEAQPLNRDLTQVTGQSGPSRWVPLGRDVLLERKLLQEISGIR